LQHNMNLVDSAVEEILRFESSLQATYRTALEPREVAGQKIEVAINCGHYAICLLGESTNLA